MHIKGIIDLIYVFIAYFILIIIMTSIMIKPITKNKNIFDRFVLYLVVGNFYIINIVFILVYLNIFNRLVLIITLLSTIFLFRIMLDKRDAKRKYLESKECMEHILYGEYGIKLFINKSLLKIRLGIKHSITELFEGNKLEWLIFLLIMCYNVYYYSYNSLYFVSFGAPDEEVHLSWIQSLIAGNIFPSGVYPHGFHNILSAITVFFGFNAVDVINCFGVISMFFIMTMLYFGLRKILMSKYAALFGLMVYSLINIYKIDLIYRFQFSIPQEYGMIILMPMAIFLFRYLKDKKISNLIFFGMCFSMTISIHFYTAIIALVLCFAIGLVYFYRILKNKLLVRILLCGILSSTVAVAPLGVGLVMGNELEQSMDWAVSVMQGNEYDDDEDYNKEEKDYSLNKNNLLENVKEEIAKYVLLDIRVMYIFLILIAFMMLYNIFLIVSRNKREENLHQLSFAVYGLLLIFLILCRPLNIPTIMESKRVGIFFAYLSPILFAIPSEILYGLFNKSKNKKICSAVTIISIPVFTFIIIQLGFLRPLPPFYYFQTKGAMLVDSHIIKKYNDFEWTIVAPVNDISVIQNNGYHYELSDFILEQENWNEDIKIQIPTRYVFIYIEKRPIVLFGHSFYKEEKEIVNRKRVTYEDAVNYLEKGKQDNSYYKEYRRIIMSKAYYWAQEYKKYFPKEMNIYYEDNEIIVYRIVQNKYALNNFAINYGANKL